MTTGRKGDFFDKVAALRRDGQPFAVATVVGRRPPVSAHLGDRAIVYADGRMDGFIGGACSKEIIRAQALDALRARHARLVSIRPDAGAADDAGGDRVTVSMSCASEGSVDVFVEPVLQPLRLVVVGATPVADALARLGGGMDYAVVRVVDAAEQRDLQADAAGSGPAIEPLESLEAALRQGASRVAAVVASQGHYDEQALETILRSGAAAYVGLVASRKRGAAVLALLAQSGVPSVDTVRNPAGMDLGACTAPEVALSILAEIVQRLPSEVVDAEAAAESAGAPAAPPTAIDPVCGMDVVVATARHQADLDGTTYYFCCPHCRAHFLSNPQAYLAARP